MIIMQLLAQSYPSKDGGLNLKYGRVNTGWSGGPYGIGSRMSIEHTRALLRSALGGLLDKVEMRMDPIFNFMVPFVVPGVPEEILDPRQSWQDKGAYDLQARELAELFKQNFEQFKDLTPEHVVAAGPQ